jgi:hypothetical protein
MVTSTMALLKGKAVRTSPRVMGPSSMLARMPPALTSAKEGAVSGVLELSR